MPVTEQDALNAILEAAVARALDAKDEDGGIDEETQDAVDRIAALAEPEELAKLMEELNAEEPDSAQLSLDLGPPVISEEVRRQATEQVDAMFLVQLAATHAPAGGVTVAGQTFAGGQFIPGDVMEKATAEEKAQVEGGGQESEELKESEVVAQMEDVKKTKDGTVWTRAPAGGSVSPVNGKHYKGGRWMPIHGLSIKPEKPSIPKPPQGGEMPKPPLEDAKARIRVERTPMSPEDIEAERLRREDKQKWNEMAAGPLGRMKWLGDSPNSKAMSNGRTDLNGWKEYAISIGEEKLKELADILKKHYDAKIDLTVNPGEDPEGVAWAKDSPRRAADDEAGLFPGSKKHLKEYPSSYYVRQLLQHNLDNAISVSDMHELNAILASKLASEK